MLLVDRLICALHGLVENTTLLAILRLVLPFVNVLCFVMVGS